MSYREFRECTVDFTDSQLSEAELEEYYEEMAEQQELERRREALRRSRRACTGWAGGMVPVH